jgi:hypothetical protein
MDAKRFVVGLALAGSSGNTTQQRAAAQGGGLAGGRCLLFSSGGTQEPAACRDSPERAESESRPHGGLAGSIEACTCHAMHLGRLWNRTERSQCGTVQAPIHVLCAQVPARTTHNPLCAYRVSPSDKLCSRGADSGSHPTSETPRHPRRCFLAPALAISPPYLLGQAILRDCRLARASHGASHHQPHPQRLHGPRIFDDLQHPKFPHLAPPAVNLSWAQKLACSCPTQLAHVQTQRTNTAFASSPFSASLDHV